MTEKMRTLLEAKEACREAGALEGVDYMLFTDAMWKARDALNAAIGEEIDRSSREAGACVLYANLGHSFSVKASVDTILRAKSWTEAQARMARVLTRAVQREFRDGPGELVKVVAMAHPQTEDASKEQAQDKPDA